MLMNKIYKIGNETRYDYIDKDLYNLTIEEQFVIDTIRNKTNDLYNIDKLDFNLILELMNDNKILNNFSGNILKLSINEKIKAKTFIAKQKYEFRKKEYIVFFKKLLPFLNKFDHRIVKGVPLQLMLDNSYNRFFLDIDIVLDNKYLDVFLREINKLFTVISTRRGLCENDCVIDIKENNFYFTIEIKDIRHPCFVNINSVKEYDFESISLYTFDLEDTIIYLINYYYWNAYNLRNLRQNFKYYLQSLIEIYYLIKNNYDNIDWERIINYFIINNRIDYLKNCLEDVYIIYMDKLILVLKEQLCEKCDNNTQNILNESYINDIPLIVRFFRKKEVRALVNKYLSGKYLLYSNNDKLLKITDDNKQIKITMQKKDSILYGEITFKNQNCSSNSKILIQINLYAFDQYGIYLGPYIPTFILNNGSILFSNEWIVDIHNDMLIKNVDEYLLDSLVYLSSISKKNKLTFKIDLNSLNIDFNKNVGINIITYVINKNNNIEKVYYLQHDFEIPIVFINKYNR